MLHLSKDIIDAGVSDLLPPVQCQCLPFSVRSEQAKQADIGGGVNVEQMMHTSRDLCEQLAASLQETLLQVDTVSVLLLHMSQREALPLSIKGVSSYKRRCYHVSMSLFHQVLVSVRRVLRSDDRLIMYADGGAAIIFPTVTVEGSVSILERAYNSVSLLQAETMEPPLIQETTIQVGISTYQGSMSDAILSMRRAECLVRTLILRPALTSHLRAMKSVVAYQPALRICKGYSKVTGKEGAKNVPYMELPKECPAHLKQIIPYIVARELRCAPVGRDQNRLTVALSNPANSESIHSLQKITGMAIFPVSCDENDLNVLLGTSW